MPIRELILNVVISKRIERHFVHQFVEYTRQNIKKSLKYLVHEKVAARDHLNALNIFHVLFESPSFKERQEGNETAESRCKTAHLNSIAKTFRIQTVFKSGYYVSFV